MFVYAKKLFRSAKNEVTRNVLEISTFPLADFFKHNLYIYMYYLGLPMFFDISDDPIYIYIYIS